MKQKNFETILYSTAGVAVMFVVLIAVYILTRAAKDRIDLSAEESLYPLARNPENPRQN